MPQRSPLEEAVFDTLAEYMARAHGMYAAPEPVWFLDWLRERGYEVTAAPGDEARKIRWAALREYIDTHSTVDEMEHGHWEGVPGV